MEIRLEKTFVLNEVAGEGAVNNAVALKYNTEICGVSLDTFMIPGRTIEAIYTSKDGETGNPDDGQYVILELNPVDAIERVRGRNEHINLHYQSVLVKQMKPIKASDGSVLEPDGEAIIAVENRTPVVERFRQFRSKGMDYNLYVPSNLENNQKYPLVLYIHDAGCNGENPLFTLLQGRGAIAFTEPDIQEETPCFVLAPQIPATVRLTTDEFTVSPELEDIMETVKELIEKYPIDPNRITTTGQSQGCMASCELLIRYPAFFAGALLVAGQWDPARMAEKTLKNSMWILVSAGDHGAGPGMTAVTDAMEKAGACFSRYYWNGKMPVAELEDAAEQAASEDSNLKYTIFDADSVKTSKNSGPGANHGGTWALVYQLRPIMKWLVHQEKDK